MKWEDWAPTRFSVLCMNHFEDRCLDKTGKYVKLRVDAVPTIFASSDDSQKRKTSVKPRSKRHTAHGGKTALMSTSQSPSDPSSTSQLYVLDKETSQTEAEAPGDPKTSDKWRVIVDEGLMKIDSFPHFFHGDYCVPQDIQWAPDTNSSTAPKDPNNVIEVKEPWHWLGLDVRGPLPQTVNGHKYILTVTDYYSKWVEAVPMQACLPPHVTKQIVDIIAHFGYPIRILSRLPHEIVHKINRELKDQLQVSVSLVVFHQQTGTVDLVTQQLIDRMISDLIEEHAADWDVFLPAKVFSLCFKEHTVTKERPFSVLCCRGLDPVQTPRGLNYSYSKLRDSIFVIR
ncbi:uncharacterized protein zgc:153292 isoform X2 [Betta splendens]|nr:uncharacterized protein zgc:153292 isoform X2 [Betta splendens]